MRILLAFSCAILMSGCANGYDLAGPVSAPPKPAYAPNDPTRNLESIANAEEDFIHVAGSNAVFFSTASADLRAEARDTLDRQATWLANHPDIMLKIEGHADERAGAEYNRALGLRRAKSVVSYLTAKGISHERFKVVSYGETLPIIPRHGDIALNRRVVTVLAY